MKKYSWQTPFDIITEAEAESNEDWAYDLPKLSAEDAAQLVRKCMLKHGPPATSILSQALDQKELSTETASAALKYMKPLYFTLLSCIAAMARSPVLPTKDLIWIAFFFGEVGDGYLPSLRTLSQRIADDLPARKFLKKELARVKDPETKRWLKSVLAEHAKKRT